MTRKRSTSAKPKGTKRPEREVTVKLTVESPEALIRFAELLGETVADLYFDGKIDLR